MSALALVRRFLLVILLFGMSGSLVELVLLDHHEDALQFIPLVLLAVGLALVPCHGWRQSPGTARAVRGLMYVFVLAGLAGIYFHYQANVEFQLEGDPTLAGRALLMKALGAKAPPALAPGTMVQLGLIGLAYTFRCEER